MSRRSILLFAVTLALALSVTAAPARAAFPAPAAAPLTLLELKISLWPEFDQPSMLVIYRGQVDQPAPASADLQLQIPASVASSLQVAYSESGQLLNIPHTDTVNGLLMTVAFTTPNGSFQLEYYDPTLTINSPNRHYSFAATNPYPAKTFTLEVQQPIGASNLTTNPALGPLTPGPDGLNYQILTRSNVPANDPIQIDLTYTKTTDTLTVNNATTQATPPAPTAPMAFASSNNWLYGLLGLAAILGVLGGLIWYTRPRLKTGKSRPPDRKKQPPSPTPKPIFCQQCGQKAKAGDQFCRNCGTQLRHSQ